MIFNMTTEDLERIKKIKHNFYLWAKANPSKFREWVLAILHKPRIFHDE